ncbi:hypothetical protein V6N13_138864 [Hibiscus sabdariffa]|uniref:Pectinesterase inhibitor domain-containing protein n=1 Tax=Hibiscus sabdariffa TaxID=183260 RepID=A0ABR2PKF0_9ROSI
MCAYLGTRCISVGKTVCSLIEYPLSCYYSISSVASSNATDPDIIFKLSLKVVIDELSKKLQAETDDTQVKHGLDVCRILFDDADSTITDQETCLDTLEELNTTEHFNATLIKELRAAMQNSSEYASNSLAIVAKILGLLTDVNITIHRRLLGFQKAESSEFPAWISPTERRLLQESKPTPNVIVAKDGSGHFKAINIAVKLIGKKNKSRFVIYVKAKYQNAGPGSTVEKRVKWAGYKSTLSEALAGKFTVTTFRQGHDWLPNATIV